MALGSQRGRVNVETRARLENIHDHKADDQSERRDDFKINQRFAADAPQFFEIAHRGNAVDDGAEDNRADQHFHQIDEGVAERFQFNARFRPEKSEGDSQQHGGERHDVDAVGFHFAATF